ncbi:hypothetical protein FKN04_09360 [Bacillus glycinifermentans]|uniref:hypothetical protein n=1 Tax=Bacillus glycinifermentans TaxID=1664069 RepID=UPI0015827C0C|nr:hypothetical protein [Bacillus glycinifermentans]NUJ16800.1 hypothetical protein [Bacillus glycinifermentans]
MLAKKEVVVFDPEIAKVGNPIKVVWYKDRPNEIRDYGIILKNKGALLVYGVINREGNFKRIELEAQIVASSPSTEVKIGNWDF